MPLASGSQGEREFLAHICGKEAISGQETHPPQFFMLFTARRASARFS